MPARDDPARHGRRRAQGAIADIASELLEARLDAGISQASAGRAAGMSHAQFGRIERGRLSALTVDQASRAAADVGLKLSVRLYPDGDPARDAAQLALLERLRQRLPQGTTWRTEVPLPIAADRRAWDAVATLGPSRLACEAETRIRDVQALERRLALKQRDGEVSVLVLVVADTQANRTALHLHREQLRQRFPLDSRQILATLRSGHLPTVSGIVVL